MSWSRSKAQAAPSTLSQLIPLLITLLFVGVLGWVLYQMYLSIAKIQATASEQMGNKNVVFTKDGVRVGVKHVHAESEVDATQSWVVKAWNLGNKSAKDQRKQQKKLSKKS